MMSEMCSGVDRAKDNERIEKFDKAIDALSDLAVSMSQFENTHRSILETIGDLVIAKKTYKNR